MLLRAQPDARLVAMSRDGGVAAFDEIVRRHESALTAYATAMAPSSRTEDVVQESLLKAYAALQDGAQPELLRAWLFRIVRNTAIDEHRTFRHHEQLDENHDGVEQPPQAFERREQLTALVAALGDLPSTQREAILQRELEGRGHEEIGASLDVSPGAVRQLIYRARERLREAAGAVIPAAFIRAVSLPGADGAVGGLGAAGALKLGVAAVVATGTIVAAGTTIEHHHSTARADAQALERPSGGGPARQIAASARRHERIGSPGEPGGSSVRDPARRTQGDRAPSSPSGGGSAPGQSGSGSGPSGNSGSGSEDSGSDDHSGPGSGSAAPESEGGSGDEGPGSSGSGSGSSSGSGSGSGEGELGNDGHGGDSGSGDGHDPLDAVDDSEG